MNSKLQYINLGCGNHYHDDWVNVDFFKTGRDVIAHNLNAGIPYPDNSFDVVYHSHVLEHFEKKKAEFFLSECHRVLKDGGIIRIAVPDLEQIIYEYQKNLVGSLAGDKNSMMNYEWIMLEMFDQTVRNYSGGRMSEYIFKPHLDNEEYIYKRIGYEGKNLRKQYFENKDKVVTDHDQKKGIIKRIKSRLKIYLAEKIFREKYSVILENLQIGKFRRSGEIHQWMYDRHSLTMLLNRHNFREIVVKTAYESKIPDFSRFNLDVIDGEVRKPDSLFIEAVK